MSTIAQWGPKTWKVDSSQILALEGLSFSYQQKADNNSTTEDDEPTNERGTELFTLSFQSVLHANAGVDIRSEIESWEQLVTEASYFYLEGKQLGPLMQLRKVGVSNVKLDDLGRLRVATLSFEFKEYDEETSSVKITSALEVGCSSSDKAIKAEANTTLNNTSETPLKVGGYVTLTGTNYATGENIPGWVKDRTHKITQISGNRVLVGGDGGINSWVNLDEVSMV